MNERRHEPLLPGFKEMAARRRELVDDLVSRRIAAGLTQTEVAARMGTSQSAVARMETGAGDVRLSTVERYAAALGQLIEWRLGDPVRGSSAAGGTVVARRGRASDEGARKGRGSGGRRDAGR